MHVAVIGTLCDLSGGPTMPNSKRILYFGLPFSDRPCRLSSSQNLPLPPLKKIFLLHVFRARRSGSVEIGRWTSIHTAISQQENIILVSHHMNRFVRNIK